MFRNTKKNLIDAIINTVDGRIEKATLKRNSKKAVRYIKLERCLINKFYGEEA